MLLFLLLLASRTKNLGNDRNHNGAESSSLDWGGVPWGMIVFTWLHLQLNCFVATANRTPHWRALWCEKKNEKIEEVITCGKIKGGLNSFNIYSVNLKFVCFGSQRGMQCQLTQRVVVRYCATIESVEWVRSCRDWVTDFYFLFLWLTTATEICFAVFRLTALRPAAKLVYVCCVQTFNIVMSFPSLVENQDNRKKDITHVSYSEHRRERLKQVMIFTVTYGFGYALTLPPNSNHAMIH